MLTRSAPAPGRSMRVRTVGVLVAMAVVLGLVGRAGAADNVVRLEGQVTAVGADGVSLSLGGDDGLRAGDEGTIAQEEVFRDGSRRKTNIARVRVTSVRPAGADATVVVSTSRIQVGQRVAFLYRGGTTRCVGAIDLAAVPSGTAVTVDGKAVKGDGPMVLHGVPCGDRAVVLGPPDQEEVRRTVTVARGQVARVAIGPAPAGEPASSAGRETAVARVPGPAPDSLGAAGPAPPAGPVVALPGGPAAEEDAPAVAIVSPGADPPAPGAAPPSEPAPESAPAGEAANLVVSAWGYRGVGLVQGVLSLGLLASQYAIEVDDRLVLGWRIGTEETTIQVPPGRRRVRVLVRNVLSRSPITLHEGFVDVDAGGTSQASVNFLISTITVNGDRAAFNRLTR